MPMAEIDTFLAAIRRLESGSFDGNYHAVGPYTGSMGRGLGAYQIMSANWANWAAAAGIPGADWRDPKAQDMVARFKMAQYYRQYGRWDAVAVAWFAGPGRVSAYLKGTNLGGVRDVTGTSVPKYVSLIDQYMGEAAGKYGPKRIPASQDAGLYQRAQREARSRNGSRSDAIARAEQAFSAPDYSAAEGVQARTDALAQALAGMDLFDPEVAQDEDDRNDGALLVALLESISARIAGGEPQDPEAVAVGGGFMVDTGEGEDDDPLDDLRAV